MTKLQVNRRLRAAALRREGLTYREIGEKIGRVDNPSVPVGVERGRQLAVSGAWIIARGGAT